jgi:hypothetical protein
MAKRNFPTEFPEAGMVLSYGRWGCREPAQRLRLQPLLRQVEPMASDDHALNSDPLFIDTGHAAAGLETVLAYRLRPNSPAIGTGKTMSDSGGRDFFGTVVPSCAGVDRGAVQSTSNCGQTR